MPSALQGLAIIDLRGDLPPPLTRAPATNAPQPRRTRTTFGVLHYNGPAAPTRAGGTRAEIVGWLRDTIIPNHISRIGADGVQYHAWIGRDGTIYQLRDWDMELWHCGDLDGNRASVALHVPIGQGQQPSPQQLASAGRFFDAVVTDYAISAGRSAIKGHLEFAPSECPGPVLMGWLTSWRTQAGDPFAAWGTKGFPIQAHERAWAPAQVWLHVARSLGAALSPHVYPYGDSRYVYVLFERGVISQWENRAPSVQGAP